MDDLYNNAWGDASDNYADAGSHASTSHTAWVPPTSPTAAHHEEADLAIPSWSTGNEIRWNEPSEHSGGFAWSATEPDLAWGTSSYEDIALGKAEVEPVADRPLSPTLEEESSSDPKLSSPELTREDSIVSANLHTSPPNLSERNSRSTSPDRDGFGTFEDALNVENVPHSPKLSPAFDEGEAWGSPWANAPPEAEDHDVAESADEWEVARRNKERLDKVVVRLRSYISVSLLTDPFAASRITCNYYIPMRRVLPRN
jgi:hypothetical protein